MTGYFSNLPSTGDLSSARSIPDLMRLQRSLAGGKKWGHSEFPGAWRGADSSGFFGLSRVGGSTNERDQTAPRTR
jgi:hypothetical protein